MNQSRRGWTRALGLLAAPVVLLAVVPLAVVAALALYVRALVMGVASLLPWPRRAPDETEAARTPHFAEPARVIGGEQGR